MDDHLTSPLPIDRHRRPAKMANGLTPEEESLPDAEDEYDDTLPADLWFRRSGRSIDPRH